MISKSEYRLSKDIQGFTLIEVMVTLAIIAVVTAISAPAFTALAPNMQLKSATRDLFSHLQEAKMLAIKENRKVSVQFSPAGYSYSEPFADDDDSGTYTVGEEFSDTNGDGVHSTLKTITLGTDYDHGIAFGTGKATKNWNGDDITATAPARITFNSRGTSASRSIYLENKNQDICYAVSTRTTGSMKTRKYDGSEPFNKKHWK